VDSLGQTARHPLQPDRRNHPKALVRGRSWLLFSRAKGIGVGDDLCHSLLVSHHLLRTLLANFYLSGKGIATGDIFVNYTPFGHSDWSKIVADVVALGADGKKVGVISTINGDANIGFYKELAAAGVSADDIPVVAFSVGEEELSGLDTTNLVGHLAAWNYFQSAESDLNDAFIAKWKAFAGEDRVTNDPMEAHVIGFNMYVQAVEKAGTTDVDAVRKAMYGLEVPNLTGGTAVMLPNHHLAKPVLIGEIQADGQFDIISQTSEVPGDAWTDFLPESAVLMSDWKDLGCGMYNTESNSCVQTLSNY